MDKQRSKAWFEKRKGRVTGSNAGAILGLNPYKTADDVLRQMVREFHGAEREFISNQATEWGTFHEAGIMAEYAMETGNSPVECGFFVHPEHDWLGASPDALVGGDTLLEIKAPYGQRDKNPPEFKSALDQPHYWVQMQVQMACTGRDLCHFYQWAPHGTRLEVVRVDMAWLAENIPLLKAFHERYLSELDNPDHLQPRRKVVETANARKLLDEYDDLSLSIEFAEARKKEIMAEFEKLADGRDALIWGRKFTKVEKAGSVSYAKVVREKLPDLDLTPWTGKPSKYWKLS